MRKDTEKELERLERELLAQDAESQSDEELLEDIKYLLGDDTPEVEPAFDNPETIHAPKGPMVYCNYSNDYGRELKEFAETGETPKKNRDQITLGLLVTACLLTTGIIGVLIYWLVALL